MTTTHLEATDEPVCNLANPDPRRVLTFFMLTIGKDAGREDDNTSAVRVG